MKKILRKKRIYMLAVPMLLGISVMLQTSGLAQQAPTAAAAARAGGQGTVVYDYADQITRLVQSGKIDELSHLNIPSSTGTVKLRDWTTQYLSEVQEQEKQRDKQYSEAVAKAQDQLKQEHYEQAMEGVVLAYRIAKDPNAFLELPWVKDLTARVSARAADLEKQGRWIESLQRYSDLNTLYEINTRFKGDMQRLARRTRLLAVYTPKTLYDMRKKVLDQEKAAAAAAATSPASAPAADDDQAPDPTSFTRWQDYVQNITVEMMRRSIEHSKEDWVENTTYDTLVKGGVDALRLFLTTPELATEFTGLGNADARKKFDAALDGALAMGAGHDLTADDVQKIVTGLIQASADSIKLPKEVILMEFTDGAMEKLDPFTAVIWPHEVPEFEKNMQGKFGGIGIQISLEKDPSNVDKIAIQKEIQKLEGPSPVEIPPALDKSKEAKVGSSYKLVVITPLEDTPAFKAGIKAGDIVTAIDGKSTEGISMDQAVSSIMGIPGTEVTLRVKRGQAPDKDYKLKRDIIKVASIKGFRRDQNNPSKWDFMLDPDSKVGYIRITGFQEDTAEELQDAIALLKSKGMRGLVVDLRFNPGGRYVRHVPAGWRNRLHQGQVQRRAVAGMEGPCPDRNSRQHAHGCARQ